MKNWDREIVRDRIGAALMLLVMAAGMALCLKHRPEQTRIPQEAETVVAEEGLLLTVIREDETLTQYAGDIEIWRGADGKSYAILYLDEEVLR